MPWHFMSVGRNIDRNFRVWEAGKQETEEGVWAADSRETSVKWQEFMMCQSSQNR